MEQVAKNVVFSGRVQGVGFRYTVERIASRQDLTGWVKNLPNGSVEALLQGSENNIQIALKEISDYFAGHIRSTKIEDQPYNPRYTDFRIAF